MAKQSLITKYEREKKKTKILELITEGLTYNQIAQQLKVTRQFVTDTLKEELASSTTPEKILEMRQHQTETLSAQAPRLHKRFLSQANLAERLTKKYEDYLDQDDRGEYNFSHLYQLHYEELLNNWPDDSEPELEKIESRARRYAFEEIEAYKRDRENVAKEMERTAKLADQHYMTMQKHYERLAKLNGLEMPTQHSLLISRTDELKVSLEQDIINTQKQLKSEPLIEAEIVEDNIDG